MYTVGVYIRLSEEDRNKASAADESESIQNQRSMLIKYCMDRGWSIYDIYCDEDYSGADKDRPDWNRLIQDCEDRKINLVLCKTQSRFSRDMEMIEHYIHGKFIEWGVRFIGTVDNADTDIDGNKKSRQINGLVNEWYLEDLSRNIRETLRHKKQKGEWTGSFAPYGYLIDPHDKNRIIIDPVASEHVREVFRMFADGIGYVQIARIMNDRNILCPTMYKRSLGLNYRCNEKYKTSHMWTDSTVYYMIRQEMYLGTMVQGKSHNLSYKSKKRVRLDRRSWIRKEGTHPAIISKELWDAVHSRLRSKTRTSFVGSEPGTRHVFSGKVFCASCGNIMYKLSSATTGGRRFVYLRCKTYKNQESACDNSTFTRFDVIEKYVLQEINNLLDEYYDENLVKLPEKKEVSREAALYGEMDITEIELERTASNSIRLYEDRLSGIISEEQFKLMNAKLRDKIDVLTGRKDEIGKELAALKNVHTDDAYREELLSRYRHITKLTHEIVNQFIKSIYIHPRQEDKSQVIEIKWNF